MRNDRCGAVGSSVWSSPLLGGLDFAIDMFFRLSLGILVLSIIPQSKAEVCEKTFGDSSKYQELFRVHFQSMDFKDCTDKLKLKEQEITESNLQQVCACMKTSLDISIRETKEDILLLGKCLACTQDQGRAGQGRAGQGRAGLS